MNENKNIFNPDAAQPTPAPATGFDTPEKIEQDLLKAEKDIAAETLHLYRMRYEKERHQWDRIFQEKEQQVLALKKELDEQEGKVKRLLLQIDEDKEAHLEQLRLTARDVEGQKLDNDKKWGVIAEEVRMFREAERAAQDRLLEEQERAIQLKKQFTAVEKSLQEQVNVRDEQILQLKEELVNKEDIWLKSRSASDGELHSLKEQLSALQQTLADERLYQGKVVEKKDKELNSLQKALQDNIVLLNSERRKQEESEKKILQIQKQIDNLENERQQMAQEFDQERILVKKQHQEDMAQREGQRMDLLRQQESQKKDAEERLLRVMKSQEIAEQQLAEEQRVRQELEDKVKLREQENHNLFAQKEQVTVEWKQMLASEQAAWQKRQTELQAELERIIAGKEQEIAAMRQELTSLQGKLAEEQRNREGESEAKKQLLAQQSKWEEERQRLIAQATLKEEEWQAAFKNEQALYQKQTDELRGKYDTQLHSRESEITKNNEELRALHEQLGDMRQKYSAERADSAGKTNKILELESQLKNLNLRYKQDMAEWENKCNLIRTQWEKQRLNLGSYESDLESQYQRDIQIFKDKIKKLNARIEELQGEKQKTASFEPQKPIADDKQLG
jgi:hypothetical protein